MSSEPRDHNSDRVFVCADSCITVPFKEPESIILLIDELRGGIDW